MQRIVMPGYFRAMGISLKAGREFDDRDLQPAGTPPVIINQTLARLLFPPGTDAIGRRVAARTVNGWMQVVGVAPDVRYEGLDREPEPWYYFCQNYPATGQSTLHMYFVVRGTIDPQSLTTLARQVARQLDPGLAIYDVRTMEQWLDRSLGMRRAYTWLFGVFAAVALLLALAGIYGVVSYTVTERTREIGIRVALGARPRQVVADVVRGTMALAGLGIAIGLCGAWFATADHDEGISRSERARSVGTRHRGRSAGNGSACGDSMASRPSGVSGPRAGLTRVGQTIVFCRLSAAVTRASPRPSAEALPANHARAFLNHHQPVGGNSRTFSDFRRWANESPRSPWSPRPARNAASDHSPKDTKTAPALPAPVSAPRRRRPPARRSRCGSRPSPPAAP